MAGSKVSLEAIGESIWIVEGKIIDFYGFPYPTRSLVVRLENGDVWIWSPVQLNQKLAEAIDKLGPVRHLVSPNKIHHLYLKEWKDRYPKAMLWGPASTLRKRKDLVFQQALNSGPPNYWRNELDQFHFIGSPLMDEIVFLHKRSRTVIVADLSENFSADFLREYWPGWKGRIAKLWKITVGHGYAPLEWRLSWINRKPARQTLQQLLATDPQQVVMAHGEWQRQNGREYLKQAFTWLES